MATAAFPALPGFLFKGPLSDALAFLQPVIYSGVCSLPPANARSLSRPATTQQRSTPRRPGKFSSQNSGIIAIVPGASVQPTHDSDFDLLVTFDHPNCSLLQAIGAG